METGRGGSSTTGTEVGLGSAGGIDAGGGAAGASEFVEVELRDALAGRGAGRGMEGGEEETESLSVVLQVSVESRENLLNPGYFAGFFAAALARILRKNPP